MVNETLVGVAAGVANATANETAVPGAVAYVRDTLWPRVTELLGAPIEHPDMVWTLAPMLVALVLMQIYFGRNKDEALGWNTAFGNSIALIFISVSLLRGLFIQSGMESITGFVTSASTVADLRFAIVFVVFLYGLLLSTISFFHWIPERLAFFIMNGISINVTAYVAIVLVNSPGVPIDQHTILGGVVIFLFVYVLSVIVRSAIPSSSFARKNRLMREINLLEQRKTFFRNREQQAGSDMLRQTYRGRAAKMDEKISKYKKRLEDLKR